MVSRLLTHGPPRSSHTTTKQTITIVMSRSLFLILSFVAIIANTATGQKESLCDRLHPQDLPQECTLSAANLNTSMSWYNA